MTLLNNHRWELFPSEKKNQKRYRWENGTAVYGPMVPILQILRLHCSSCFYLLICWLSLQKWFLGWLSSYCFTFNDILVSLLMLNQTRHLLRLYHSFISVCVPGLLLCAVYLCCILAFFPGATFDLGANSSLRCCMQSEHNLHLCNCFCNLIFQLILCRALLPKDFTRQCQNGSLYCMGNQSSCSCYS